MRCVVLHHLPGLAHHVHHLAHLLADLSGIRAGCRGGALQLADPGFQGRNLGTQGSRLLARSRLNGRHTGCQQTDKRQSAYDDSEGK